MSKLLKKFFSLKQEQVPLIDSYPYLVPKTYETFDYDYRKWFKHELHNCDVQVNKIYQFQIVCLSN